MEESDKAEATLLFAKTMIRISITAEPLIKLLTIMRKTDKRPDGKHWKLMAEISLAAILETVTNNNYDEALEINELVRKRLIEGDNKENVN